MREERQEASESGMFPAALYPKRNKVKAAAADDDGEGTINIIAATFPIKPQRSLYFTPVKMSEATSERDRDGRTDRGRRAVDGSGSSKCVTRARCNTAWIAEVLWNRIPY